MITKIEFINDILPFTLKSESGLAYNVANDLGGLTYRGITHKNFPKWEGWNFLLKKDLKNVPRGTIFKELENLVHDFYFKEFFLQFQILNSKKIALALFDYKVNGGLSLSKLLKNFNISKLSELNNKNENDVLNYIINDRLNHYNNIIKSNPKQIANKKGWLNRVNNLKKFLNIQTSLLPLALILIGTFFLIYKLKN